ncbi:MAG: 6-phosphogluconolactonase [Candidatus Deferrimicrobiaceae bacterium]
MEGAVTKGRDLLSGRLFVLSTPEELARAAAGRLWGIARERAMVLARSGKGARRITVALSGGNTPRPTLAALSSEPYRSRFPWDLVHIYQVDERWVSPEDASSNQRMLRETLVSRAPIPPDHFHPVDTSLPDPREGVRRYEEMLRRAFRETTGGFPRFDAVLLGLGTDGHTASLFPGSPVLDEGTAWVGKAEGGDPPVPRITLTLPLLNASSHVIFLVSGREKALVLEKILTGKGAGLPASRVAPRRGKVTFLADADAASRLEGESAPAPGVGDVRNGKGGAA